MIDEENIKSIETKPIYSNQLTNNIVQINDKNSTMSQAITFNSDIDCKYHNEKYNCKPSDVYKYQYKDETLAFVIVRYDIECGGKEIIPFTYDELQKKWISKLLANQERPLYNLPKLISNPTKTVLLVEGEKTVKAAELLFPQYIVATSSMGSNAYKKTDWLPLKNRDVIFSYDCDESGKKYMHDVCKILKDIGAKIQIFDTELLSKFIIDNSNITVRKEGTKKGYDLADSLKEGWTSELIELTKEDERFNLLFRSFNDYSSKNFDEDEEILKLINNEFKLKNNILYVKQFIQLPSVGKEKPTTEEVWERLCGYLKVTHHIRDKNGNNWSIVLHFSDIDKKKKDLIIKKKELVVDKLIMEKLLENGLQIFALKKKFNKNLLTHDIINDYVNSSNPKLKAILVDKVGWHDNCYVMPFIDNPKNVYLIEASDFEEGIDIKNRDIKEEYILQVNTSNPRKLIRKGSIDGWKNNIGRLASGNSLLTFACAASLVPPLLKVLGEEGCCFHFSGSSSIGKTTALIVASSIWGIGKPSSFRTTDNAAESLCKNSNDGLLLMDELAEVDPNSLEKIAYLFGNGTGKGRSKKNGDAQVIETFRILGLSTGEVGLQAKLAEKGKSTTAGQSVRFIEIPADSGGNLGIFDTLHDFENGRALSDHLKKDTKDCGIVIDEFMKYVVSDFENIRILATKLIDNWLEKCLQTNSSAQVERVAKKFALVAAVGEIAINAGILPFEQLSVSLSCKTLFDRWLEQKGGNESHEFQGIVERLTRLVQEDINSRFLNANGSDESRNIREIAGYKKYGHDGLVEYWINPNVFKREILQNRNERVFYKQLIEAGYIIPDKDKTTQIKRPAKEQSKRFIVISASKIN